MKIKKWDDDYIWFTDGATISYDHKQECCECNYADFSVLEVFYQNEEFDDFEVIPVDDCGFILSLKLPEPNRLYYDYYPQTKKILIPCYSDQNGCYSSDLTIIINRPNCEPKVIRLECEERYW